MCIEEIERMISYQRKTIKNAVKITKEFRIGYMAALNTLSASIEAERENEGEEFLQKIG